MQVGEGGGRFSCFFQSSPVTERSSSQAVPSTNESSFLRGKPLTLQQCFPSTKPGTDLVRARSQLHESFCSPDFPMIKWWFGFLLIPPAASSLHWVSLLSAREKAFAISAQLLQSPATAARENSAAWARYRPFFSTGVSLPMPYKA